MTHEQFIKLETARLAKQAGFDWECNERYREGHSTNDSEPLYISPRDNWNQDADLYSAPTQSVLQRWLREEKGYQVTVFLTPQVIEEEDCDPRYEFDPNRYGYHVENLNDKGCVEFDDYNCIGYEAALEAGLKQCLTLLIEKQ